MCGEVTSTSPVTGRRARARSSRPPPQRTADAMRDGRRAHLPGPVLRRALAGPRRLPPPHRRAVGARRRTPTRCSTPSSPGRSSRSSSTSSASTTACSPTSRASSPASRTSSSATAPTERVELVSLRAPCTAASSGASRSRSLTPAGRHVPGAGRALRDLRAAPRVPPAARRATTTSAWSPAPARPARAARRARRRDGARARRRRPRLDPPALEAERYERLHHQADLQVAARTTRAGRRTATSSRRAARGYAMLPAVSPGDVFFDLEGDPYVGDGGIEYLWGWWTRRRRLRVRLGARRRRREGGARALRRPRRASARAGTRTCTSTTTRRTSARSCGRSRSSTRRARRRSTRCCASEVLVDLYAVVRQALQVGEESYSLKKLERHHGFVRARADACARAAARSSPTRPGSRRGDADLLEAIRAYNEEDCRSTAVAPRLAAGDDAARGRGRVRRRLRRAARAGARGGARPAGVDAGRAAR